MNRAYQIVYNTSIWDLMKREINFLWTMNKNIGDVESRLLKPNKFSKIQFSNTKLAKSQVHNIISNIKAIVEVHGMILEDLTDIYTEQWPLIHDIGKILLIKTKLFVVYRTYVDMHCHFQRIIATSKDEDLLDDLDLILESTSSSYGSRSLKDVITLAFKHISAWKIPLQKLVDVSLTYNVNVIDTHNIMQTYAVMKRIGRFFHLLQDWKQRELVKHIEEKIITDQPLNLSNNIHRRFINEGSVTFNSQTRYIFLFNDFLIICKQPQKKLKGQYRFKFMIDLIGCSFNFSQKKGEKKEVILSTSNKSFTLHSKSTTQVVQHPIDWSVLFEDIYDRWKNAVFRVPIIWLLKRENQSEDSGVPRIVSDIIKTLNESNELNETMLCSSDDTYSVSVVRNSIEESNGNYINWQDYACETLVGILKLFFDELPEPLLEWNYCTQFPLFTPDKKADKEGITEMILCLSPPNRNCLFTIISFLHKSKLDPVLLSLNWGHYLLRLSNESSLDTATDIQYGVDVIKELITNCNDFFNASQDAIMNPRRQTLKEFSRGRSLIKIQ